MARVRVVIVPSAFVSTGWGIPAICVRHGRPEAERRAVTFRSLVSGWAFLLFPAMIVALATLRQVRSPGWPFCPRCRRIHVLRNAVRYGLFGLAVLATVLGFLMIETEHAAMRTGLLVIVLLALATYSIPKTSRSRVAGGYVAANGATVEFRKPHPDFVTAVAAAKQAAADYHARQYS
jgi:hypothetical protein